MIFEQIYRLLDCNGFGQIDYESKDIQDICQILRKYILKLL